MRNLLACSVILASFALVAPAHAQGRGSDVGARESREAATGAFVVYFALNSASLTASARQTIAEAAAEYRRDGTARVTVVGHTDTSGSAEYNQRLSERRAAAVRDALAAQGVPATTLSVSAVGQNDLAVQTPDNVREGANRRVTIQFAQAAPPPAPAPAPPPVAAAPKRFAVELGGIYGHNQKESDTFDSTSNLPGIELSFVFLPENAVSFSIDQALLVATNSLQDDDPAGRTVLGVDFGLPLGIFRPFIGANVGGAYGAGVQDGFVVGPEIGAKVGLGETVYLYAKAAYDFQFRNPSMDDGIIWGGAGLGLKF